MFSKFGGKVLEQGLHMDFSSTPQCLPGVASAQNIFRVTAMKPCGIDASVPHLIESFSLPDALNMLHYPKR